MEVNNNRQPTMRVPGSDRRKTDIQRIEVRAARSTEVVFSSVSVVSRIHLPFSRRPGSGKMNGGLNLRF